MIINIKFIHGHENFFHIEKRKNAFSIERHFVCLEGKLSTMRIFHNTLFCHFPFTLFNIITFIMLFLPFARPILIFAKDLSNKEKGQQW